MIPLHYVAGRDCDSLFEALCASFHKYPSYTVELVACAIFIIAIIIYFIYITFNPPKWARE